MIISTGMATIGELDKIVSTIHEAGCEQFVLLKCTSTYPAIPENSNVLTITHMRELFSCEVGLSDHTMGVGTAVTAVWPTGHQSLKNTSPYVVRMVVLIPFSQWNPRN